MAELWFWMDPHLGHDNIRRHCNRPFQTCEEMNQVLITNYCKYVCNDDTIIIGGDYAWHSHERFFAQLPGKKILVWGNHDNMPPQAIRNFTEVVGRRRRPGILELAVGPYQLTVCHFPLLSWNASFHGSWHIHGHCHGRLPEPNDVLRTDAGVDVWDYAPVNFDVIRRKLESRIPAWKERMRRLKELHADEEPGDSIRVNTNENRAWINQWLDDAKNGIIKTNEDYHTRYGWHVHTQDVPDELPGGMSKPGPANKTVSPG